jgi:serine/threonine protein kinase
MTKQPPNPGNRYIVRELLGRGRWKEVYRAVVRGGFDDRALARFIKEPGAAALFDEIKFLLPKEREARLENVAQLYRVFKGDDGDVYLEEELLYRPLESLAPLVIVDKFFQIARDLCNGLASLHRAGRIHRDLKLDNCGVDHFRTAKIFDLGSVTSEGAEVKGSTLSRAPELFAADPKCSKASDVWAMGAVLFALRTGGDYPFVSKEEAKNRPLDGDERKRFDERVQSRATDQGAGGSLARRVDMEFPNGSGELVRAMLDINPANRPSAEEATDRWRQLLLPWTPVSLSERVDRTDLEFLDICAYLTAYVRGTTAMSSLQWSRIKSATDKLDEKLDEPRKSELLQIRKQAQEMRETIAT